MGEGKHPGENGDYRECLYISEPGGGATMERRHDTMSVLSEGS